MAVARAAVEAKINYIDICDDYEAAEILFASDIDKAAKEAGITVLTGMGSDPGTNNVIVKWYADHLDRVDEIALFWVVSIAELAGAAWDHSLHMTIGKIPQYLDGKLEYVEGGTGEETATFLEPLGTCQVRYVGHPQPLTIPRYIKGVKRVVIKGALIPSWVDQLIKEQKETGFLSKEPIEVKGTKVVPYDLTLKLWGAIPKNRDKGPARFRSESDRKGREKRETGDLHRRHRGQDGAGNRTSRLDRGSHAGCGRCEGKGSGSPGRLHRSGKIPCGIAAKRRQNTSDGNDNVDA